MSAGLQAFATRCSSCHGVDGSGSSAPALRSASLARGSSDWALYKVIQQGIPASGMPAHDLGDRELWRLVAAVTELRRRFSATPDSTAGALALRVVSADDLVRAASDSGNWLMYHGAYDGWRHSRLRQIDSSNASRLRVRWIYQTEHDFKRVETTPLVVGHTMYLTEPGATVVALDAATGAERWRFTPRLGELRLCCGLVNRGLAILDSTLYLGTPDARLLALSARTGAVRWDIAVAPSEHGYSLTSAPLVIGNLVIVGVAGGEFGIRGFVDAYDAGSGKRVWRFHTIPEAGAPGSETWGKPEAMATGGGPAWLTGSWDPDLGLVYLGVGNPSPDYDGSERPGDNLYTNSVSHSRQPPGSWPGISSSRLTTPTTTMRCRFRRWSMPPSTALSAGSCSSPTRTGFTTSSIACPDDSSRRGRSQPRHGPRASTPPVVPSPGQRPRLRRPGRLVYPSQNGATNWWSPWFSPRTGLFYIPVHEQGSVFFRRGEDYDAGEDYLGGHGQIRTADAAGFLRAVDARTGEPRWEHQFQGELPANLMGGILTTAGGVVFSGAGATFVALHDRTGKVLWSHNVGGDVASAPISYLQGGRQLVTVAAGRAIITFELPRCTEPRASRSSTDSTDPEGSMKLRRWVGVSLLLATLLVASGLTISAVPSMRWRATVARLKVTGQLPELSWVELYRMLRPDSPYSIEGCRHPPEWLRRSEQSLPR